MIERKHLIGDLACSKEEAASADRAVDHVAVDADCMVAVASNGVVAHCVPIDSQWSFLVGIEQLREGPLSYDGESVTINGDPIEQPDKPALKPADLISSDVPDVLVSIPVGRLLAVLGQAVRTNTEVVTFGLHYAKGRTWRSRPIEQPVQYWFGPNGDDGFGCICTEELDEEKAEQMLALTRNVGEGRPAWAPTKQRERAASREKDVSPERLDAVDEWLQELTTEFGS